MSQNQGLKKYILKYISPQVRMSLKTFISRTVWKFSPNYRSSLRTEQELSSIKQIQNSFHASSQADINKLQRELFGIKETLDENIALHTDSAVIVLERQSNLMCVLEKRFLDLDKEIKALNDKLDSFKV